MFERKICRGDIYYANLNPTAGSEQGGIRPVIVLQNNCGNRYSPTVIVAAITGKSKKPLPTHVTIERGELHKPSVVLLEQIRTIDKGRLKEYVTSVNNEKIAEIDIALKISVGLAPTYRMEE